MFPSNAYVIRHAQEADAAVLRRLAAVDSQAPLAGPALVGEIDGRPVGAVSLISGRGISDPFLPTQKLMILVRMRARGITAADAKPSLRERIRDGIRLRRPVAAPAA